MGNHGGNPWQCRYCKARKPKVRFSPEQEFFIIPSRERGGFFMKIYTKTGDKGKTSLFGGKRVSKADLRIEIYGEIDELNSIIGVAIAQIQNPRFARRGKFKRQSYSSKLKNELFKIQDDLFEVYSILTSLNTKYKILNTKYLKNRTFEFENLIDEITKELPELTNFILPGGGEAGSFLHLARLVCRRVERRIVALSRKEKINPQILVYFNRLSDLLFVMARFVNFQEKQKEIIWRKE